jgi:hypothetical protein
MLRRRLTSSYVRWFGKKICIKSGRGIIVFKPARAQGIRHTVCLGDGINEALSKNGNSQKVNKSQVFVGIWAF